MHEDASGSAAAVDRRIDLGSGAGELGRPPERAARRSGGDRRAAAVRRERGATRRGHAGHRGGRTPSSARLAAARSAPSTAPTTPELHREVALKVIRPVHPDAPFDPERALDEARAPRARQSPQRRAGVPRRPVDDEVGMAMELIPGDTLDALVQQRGPFSANEAALIGMDLCRALAAVHGTRHAARRRQGAQRDARRRRPHHAHRLRHQQGSEPRSACASRATSPARRSISRPRCSRARRARSPPTSTASACCSSISSPARIPWTARRSPKWAAVTTSGGARRLLRDVRPDLPDDFVRVVEQALADDPQARYASAGAFEVGAERRRLAVPALDPRARSRCSSCGRCSCWRAIVAFVAPWRDRERRTAAAVAASQITATVALPVGQLSRGRRGLSRSGRRGPEARARRAAVDRRSLSLHLHTSVPAYVYVVNEDEMGDSYLLFPIKGRTDTQSAGRRYGAPLARLAGQRASVVASDVRRHPRALPDLRHSRTIAHLRPPVRLAAGTGAGRAARGQDSRHCRRYAARHRRTRVHARARGPGHATRSRPTRRRCRRARKRRTACGCARSPSRTHAFSERQLASASSECLDTRAPKGERDDPILPAPRLRCPRPAGHALRSLARTRARSVLSRRRPRRRHHVRPAVRDLPRLQRHRWRRPATHATEAAERAR